VQCLVRFIEVLLRPRSDLGTRLSLLANRDSNYDLTSSALTVSYYVNCAAFFHYFLRLINSPFAPNNDPLNSVFERKKSCSLEFLTQVNLSATAFTIKLLLTSIHSAVTEVSLVFITD
jgi:hypothetical protein